MKAIVFVDGSNFYHRLKFLTKERPKLSLLDYVGASDSQSFGLTKATSDYLILRAEDVEQFLPKSINITENPDK